MMTPQRVGALALSCLLLGFPAAAENPGAQEPGPKPEGTSQGLGKETERRQVSTRGMDAMRRRLAMIEEIQDLDQAIAELEQFLADLSKERQNWDARRRDLHNRIASVDDEIEDTGEEIAVVENQIVLSSIASGGVPSPELIVIRERLSNQLDRLKGQRSRLKSDWNEAVQKIAMLDELIAETQRKVAAKRNEKLGVKSKLADVSIVAPSEGARLMVGTKKELRMRSATPPSRIHIEIQRYSVRGGTTPEAAVQKTWSTVHDRTHAWKDLGSGGPDIASLTLELGDPTSGRTIHKPSMLRLDKGKYRARVHRVGAPRGASGRSGGDAQSAAKEEDEGPNGLRTSAEYSTPGGGGRGTARMEKPTSWRSFEVVGRLGSGAIQPKREVELAPGQPRPKNEVQEIQRPPSGLMPKGRLKSPTGDDD